MSVETLNRQQAILEAANELIATVSMDQRLTYINLAGRRMLGIPVSLNLDLERLHVRDFHPSGSYQLLNEQIFPQVVASCETWEGELELRNLKGEVFPAHLTLVPHTSEAKDEVLWKRWDALLF